jgi:hypothetical protein
MPRRVGSPAAESGAGVIDDELPPVIGERYRDITAGLCGGRPYTESNMEQTQVPPGFKEDLRGRLVPESQIRPIDLTRDALVEQLVERAKPLREALAAFRKQAFDDIQAFIDLSAEQYRAKIGGLKGNVSLLSYDGRYKIQRAISETIVFDERLQAAKSLIDECLTDWVEGARPEIATLVQDAFRVDSSGNIRTGSVLGLRRLNITDERWVRAMQAIGEALQVVGSKTYLRIYERDANGGYQPISLDIAGV